MKVEQNPFANVRGSPDIGDKVAAYWSRQFCRLYLEEYALRNTVARRTFQANRKRTGKGLQWENERIYTGMSGKSAVCSTPIHSTETPHLIVFKVAAILELPALLGGKCV